MKPALLKVYGLEQWAEDHTLRTTGLRVANNLKGENLNPSTVEESLRYGPQVSTDAGSVLLKEEIQAERWYCATLPISNRSMVGGLGSQEDIRKL